MPRLIFAGSLGNGSCPTERSFEEIQNGKKWAFSGFEITSHISNAIRKRKIPALLLIVFQRDKGPLFGVERRHDIMNLLF